MSVRRWTSRNGDAFTRLRLRDALSYAVERTQLRFAGRTLEYLQADGLAEAFPRILEGLVGVVEELAEVGPSADEMQLSREVYDQSFDNPGNALEYLIGAAQRRLLGMPDRSPDELRDRWRALTAQQLRDGLAEILPTLLAIGPEEIGEEPPGWRADVMWSHDRVTGVEYEPIDDREEGALVVGAEGVSWVAPDERCRTVRWDETVACFTWDDGRRTVLGPAGEWVQVVPWAWRGGHGLTGLVDDETDPHRRIRLGEGETLYLQDPADPASTTDVRWLGSLIAARYDGLLVDLVIDTDGLFLLFDEPTSTLHTRRLQARRASSRDELLGADPRNQWVPARHRAHDRHRQAAWLAAHEGHPQDHHPRCQGVRPHARQVGRRADGAQPVPEGARVTFRGVTPKPLSGFRPNVGVLAGRASTHG